jgi:hypothetical protein
LRAVSTAKGIVIGAASINTRISESLLYGQKSQQDSYAVYDKIGLEAAQKIIDMVYPARIVSAEPLVLNRGSNDGVNVGDVYEVKREGKVIKDANGVELGRVESSVGSVKLVQVQDTISVLQVVSGNVAQNDLAVLKQQASGQAATSNRAKIGSQKSAGQAKPQKATLAVGQIHIGRTGNVSGLNNIDRVTDDLVVKLSNTRRFQLLERSEVDQVIQEKMFDHAVGSQDIMASLKQLF